MALVNDFDKYFLHLPPLVKEVDFSNFWKHAISEQKKLAMEASFTLNKRRSTGKFSAYDLVFNGFQKTQQNGILYIPDRLKRPNVAILIHDYNDPHYYMDFPFDEQFAYLVLTMRGHSMLNVVKEENQATPGFLVENILDIHQYYVTAVYLDTLRSIDALRLNNNINCSRIAMVGKGLGAAASVFTAAFSQRVQALVLETPSLTYLELSQNLSDGDAASEINDYIATHRSKKQSLKKNLSYVDALNFSDKITCPVLSTVGFRDTISPPESVFALFNHFQCDKTMEVYPDEGHSAGGKTQFIKSIEWLKEVLPSE